MKQQNKIPERWGVVKFGEVFNFIKTYPFPRDYLTEGEEGIKYIHYGDIHAKFKNLIVNVESEKIPTLKDKILVKNGDSFLKDGDLIIVDASEDYEGTGKCIELKNVGNKKIISGLHTFALRDINKRIVDGFRGYLLKHPVTARELRKKATGFSVYGISKDTLSNLDLFIPSKEEQQAISKILSEVDLELDIIDKERKTTEKLKKGIMVKLLENPSWKKVRLGEIIKIIGGFAFKSEDFMSAGKNVIPLIKIGDLQNGLILYNERTSYVKQELYDKLPDFQLSKGDVLIALSGATTGKISAVREENLPALLNQRVGKFKIKDDFKIISEYFYQLSQSNDFIKFILKNIGQSAQGNLSPSDLEKIEIPLPSIEEQKKISSILSTIDKEIELENKRKNKVERIKKGLMYDLLTGNKRVNIENVLKIGGGK